MGSPRLSFRLVNAAVAAFCLYTLALAIWGFVTTGDDFANGNKFSFPSLVGASVLGLFVGFFLSGRSLFVLLFAAMLTLCFWVFVPDGWWVIGPH